MEPKTVLVVTSIASPNVALKELARGCRRHGVEFFVIGDESSPRQFELGGCRFYDLKEQTELGFAFARQCPTRSYARKNIGYLLAMRTGASVLAEGLGPAAPGLDGIGIREAVEYLHGRRPRESVAEAIAVSTRQYAKRQQTWFRHQLTGAVLTLDATRPPERLAAEIAQAWEQSGA